MTNLGAQLGNDLRHALGALIKRPLFCSAAVVSIAVGAGLNVGVYTIMRHVLFDNPMTTAPERFIRIQPGISLPHYRELRRLDLPMDLIAMQMSTLTWRTGDTTRTLSAHVVSDNFLEAVGVRPILGRTISAVDAGTDVAVLSFQFWERHFFSDPTVIGRTLELNGWPHTIVGVLPKGFAVNALVGGMVYVPISTHVATAIDNRLAAQFDLIGRLDTGMSSDDGIKRLRLGAARLETQYPAAERGFARRVRASSTNAFSMFRDEPAGRVVLAAAATFYGLVGLVLLIACANVAGLMLVRADERRHEMAVRIALGAPRARLIRQAFLEPLVIGASGCAAGVTLWSVTTSMLQRAIASQALVVPVAFSAPIPIGYSASLIVIITLACGFASATRAFRFSGVADTRLRGGFSRGFGLHRALVAVQITVSFVLLAAAAFFLDSVIRLRVIDPGFDIGHVILCDVREPPSPTLPSPIMVWKAIASSPGIEAASWGSPIGAPFTERLQRVDSEDSSGIPVDIRVVGPRFFETFRIPLVRGRDILETDLTVAASLPVVVNDTFARRYLSGVDPIGQRFVRGANVESGRPEQVLQVVGIARDSMARTVGESRVPVVYLPQLSRALAIRVPRVTGETLATLSGRIHTLHPPNGIITVVPLSDTVAGAIAPVRAATMLFGCLAVIALVLASIGLYAVVSYAVSQRTFEIGIRIALGATRTAIVRMIVRDGVRIVATGCVVGAGVSWLLGRLVRRAIVAQDVITPITLGAVISLLLIVGIAASLHPASRAATADPIKALRHE